MFKPTEVNVKANTKLPAIILLIAVFDNLLISGFPPCSFFENEKNNHNTTYLTYVLNNMIDIEEMR